MVSHDNNSDNSKLTDEVKHISLKIKLLEDDQREIVEQLQLVTEKLVGPTPQSGGNTHFSNNQAKPITHKEVTKILAKAKAEDAFKKKGNKPEYPIEMDLVPFPPKFKQPELNLYFGDTSAYRHITHFNNLAGAWLV